MLDLVNRTKFEVPSSAGSASGAIEGISRQLLHSKGHEWQSGLAEVLKFCYKQHNLAMSPMISPKLGLPLPRTPSRLWHICSPSTDMSLLKSQLP